MPKFRCVAATLLTLAALMVVPSLAGADPCGPDNPDQCLYDNVPLYSKVQQYEATAVNTAQPYKDAATAAAKPATDSAGPTVNTAIGTAFSAFGTVYNTTLGLYGAAWAAEAQAQGTALAAVPAPVYQAWTNANTTVRAVSDGTATAERCTAAMLLEEGMDDTGGCYAGNPSHPPASDPNHHEGAAYDPAVQTANTYSTDADVANDLATDLAGHANVVQLQTTEEVTGTATARVYLASSVTPGVNADSEVPMVEVASGTFSDGRLALTASYSDAIKDAATSNNGYVDLMVIVETGDRFWQQFFVRRIGKTRAGNLVFLTQRGEHPGRFLVDMDGPDSFAAVPADAAVPTPPDPPSPPSPTDNRQQDVNSVVALAQTTAAGAQATAQETMATGGCRTSKYGDPFTGSTVIGEAHAGETQTITFYYGHTDSAAQTIDVIAGPSPSSGYKVSGQSTKKVSHSAEQSTEFYANYNGYPTRFKINASWWYQRYLTHCRPQGPNHFPDRYDTEPVRWAGGFNAGDFTGSVCSTAWNDEYLFDYPRRSKNKSSSEKVMRWKAAAQIFNVTIGAENENTTTAQHMWRMGTTGLHHYLCGTDDDPMTATRTFAQ